MNLTTARALLHAAAVMTIGLAAATGSTLVLAQTAAGDVTLTTVPGTDGKQYVYAITKERADAVRPWDPAAVPDPPLSLAEARTAAERWMTARTPELKTFDLASAFLIRGGRCGTDACWFYRMFFDPIVGGRRLAGGGADFSVVVLIDGSIVEPRINTAPSPAGPGRGGGGPGGPGSGTGGLVPQ